MEVRRKAMSIILSMTSSRNVEEVVLFLKKQLQRTQEREFDKVGLVVPASYGRFDTSWDRPLSTGNF